MGYVHAQETLQAFVRASQATLAAMGQGRMRLALLETVQVLQLRRAREWEAFVRVTGFARLMSARAILRILDTIVPCAHALKAMHGLMNLRQRMLPTVWQNAVIVASVIVLPELAVVNQDLKGQLATALRALGYQEVAMSSAMGVEDV